MNYGEKTCYASLKYMPSSTYKWEIVAGLIRNIPTAKALQQLSFSKKGCAPHMHKLLLSCIANGENNHGLDVDRMIVYRVLVGKAFTLKRFMARGRGRSTRIEKRYSRITIVLKQVDDVNSLDKKSTEKNKKANTETKGIIKSIKKVIEKKKEGVDKTKKADKKPIAKETAQSGNVNKTKGTPKNKKVINRTTHGTES